MLKYIVNDLSEVDEAFHSLYSESKLDGRTVMVLQVEGVVPKGKLDEFRNNNIALKRQLEEVTERFAGIEMEPAEIKALIDQKDAIEEAARNGRKNVDIDKMLNERTARLREDYERRISAVSKERDGLSSQLAERVISQEVLRVAAEKGLRSTAQLDVTSRARALFTLADGKPVAQRDGQPVYGKDGFTPLSVEEWVESLTAEAPHLFEGSSGAGANGAIRSQNQLPGRNPWKGGRGSRDWNLTEQGKMIRDNPSLAKRLMHQAGIRPPASLANA